MVEKLLLFSVLPLVVQAANDWSKPCVAGTCSYDAGDGISAAYSSLILNGPGSSLSDITPAAGWQIAGCSPTWSSGTQDVQVTCAGRPEQTSLCAHVLQGGPEDKIVRLPENCGTGPFARVVSWSTSKSSRRARAPKTHAVTLDFNFKKINPNGKGRVSFSATATNVRNNSTLSAANLRTRGRRRLLESRFNETDSINAPPLKLSKNFNLVDQSFNCAANGGVGVDASLKVDVDVGVDAQLAFGYIVAGTIIPPALTQLALTATMTGDASAEFNVAANVKGSFDTGSVQLFKQGLPGLNFPGVLNLGPQFVVNGQITADLGVQANVKAGAKWTFPTVSLIFPPDQGRSVAQAVPAQTPLDLSINPSATVNGALTGHIVPRVELGIDVLDGLAEATVFLDVDVSSTLGLQVTAQASAGTDAAASAGASGCVTLNGAVDIAAGATGAIKPIFDKNVNFDIFNKKAQLFQRCFNTPASSAAAATSTSADSAATSADSTSTDASDATDAATSTDAGTTSTEAPETDASTSADADAAAETASTDDTDDSATETDSADPDTSATDSAEAAAETDADADASPTDSADAAASTDSDDDADVDAAGGAEAPNDADTAGQDDADQSTDDAAAADSDVSGGSDDNVDPTGDADLSGDQNSNVSGGGEDDSAVDDADDNAVSDVGGDNAGSDPADAGVDDSSFDDPGFDDSTFDDSDFDDSSSSEGTGFDDSGFDDSSFDNSSLDNSGFDDAGFDDSSFGGEDDFDIKRAVRRSVLPRGLVCPDAADAASELVNVVSQ